MNRDFLRHIPNTISVLRILLIIPIIAAIWHEEYRLAFFLILVAGLSDGIDGFLARFFNWKSQLGALLDPLADKILLVSLFVVFALKELIPVWLMLLVVGRDIIIISGAIAYQLLTHRLEMRPLIISKINTALQILLVVLVAIQLSDIHIADSLLNVMIIVVALSTLASGVSYVYTWTRYAIAASHDKKSLKD